MSVHGRFSVRRNSVYDQDSFESNSTERVAYEVGTGAEFMERAGWSSRPPYCQNVQEQNGSQISFYKYSRSKCTLLISLIVVSIILLLFIVAIVILFALKVIVLNSNDNTDYSASNGNFTTVTSSSSTSQLPIWTQPQLYPITVRKTTINTLQTEPSTITFARPLLRKQQFMCQLYIKNQANLSYNNTSSYEYRQASQLAYNAVYKMVLTTSLNQYLQSLNIVSLINSGNDLIVSVNISFQSSADNPISIGLLRSVFQSNNGMLENLLNHVEIDNERLIIQST